MVEVAEDGVAGALFRVGVEEELGRLVPEDLVRRELQEDLGEDAHLEVVDGRLLPRGELGLVLDDSGLEHAHREGVDGVVGLHAAAVRVVDGHAAVGLRDLLDDSLELEPIVILLQNFGRETTQPVAVSALIDDEVVFLGVSVKGGILRRVSICREKSRQDGLT